MTTRNRVVAEKRGGAGDNQRRGLGRKGSYLQRPSRRPGPAALPCGRAPTRLRPSAGRGGMRPRGLEHGPPAAHLLPRLELIYSPARCCS